MPHSSGVFDARLRRPEECPFAQLMNEYDVGHLDRDRGRGDPGQQAEGEQQPAEELDATDERTQASRPAREPELPKNFT